MAENEKEPVQWRKRQRSDGRRERSDFGGQRERAREESEGKKDGKKERWKEEFGEGRRERIKRGKGVEGEAGGWERCELSWRRAAQAR